MALTDQLKVLGGVLDQRTVRSQELARYDEGGAKIPTGVIRSRMTQAYQTLMGPSEAPWGSLVVDSVQDRLEVAGVRDESDSTAERVWELWQENSMDAESTLAHRSVLLDGRAFATVWRDPETKRPAISLDDCTQVCVQYEEGSRRRRIAALRRWVDDFETPYATLFRPDGIYKFVGPEKAHVTPDIRWSRRSIQGEPWPLPNPLGVVPVVEVAVNRRLRPGSFGYARGEYEHCTSLIDRVNLLTFLGLVVAVWMGFPLRGVIGDRILRDDEDNPLPPFESRPDSVVQFETPEAKVFQLDAADRKNLSVFAELDQLAVITKTPRHYFPLEQGMSNISADAIRASEGGLHAKVTGHKASLGEGWEEVLRLAGQLLPDPVTLSPRAELVWKDHQSRSLAERADAATKLASIPGLPFQAIAERALNATSDEIARWESQAASGALNQLLAEAQMPSRDAATNGNGSAVPAG